MDSERVPSDTRTDESANLNEERRRVHPLWAWVGGWMGLSLFVELVNNLRHVSLLP
jgi:hypothetical protein